MKMDQPFTAQRKYTYAIPLKFVEVMRQTRTSIDITSEHTLNDDRNEEWKYKEHVAQVLTWKEVLGGEVWGRGLGGRRGRTGGGWVWWRGCLGRRSA